MPYSYWKGTFLCFHRNFRMACQQLKACSNIAYISSITSLVIELSMIKIHSELIALVHSHHSLWLNWLFSMHMEKPAAQPHFGTNRWRLKLQNCPSEWDKLLYIYIFAWPTSNKQLVLFRLSSQQQVYIWWILYKINNIGFPTRIDSSFCSAFLPSWGGPTKEAFLEKAGRW